MALGVTQLETVHKVANSPADVLEQWFNVGGMLQFYDYSLDVYINVKQALHGFTRSSISNVLHRLPKP
jgi:hypothetical protein